MTARRAWLTKDDVLNALPLKDFKRMLRRNRQRLIARDNTQ